MSEQGTQLTRSVAQIRRLFGAAACSCALVSADDALTFVAADGIGAGAIVGTTIPLGKGIAGFAVLTGQPLAVADVGQDSRFARDVAEATDYVPTTILAAPMLDADGEPLGVVEVLDPSTRSSDTGRDLDVLGSLAGQLATIVQLTNSVATQSDPRLDSLRRSVAALAESDSAGIRLTEHVIEAVHQFLRERA